MVSCALLVRQLGPFDVIESPDWMAEGLLISKVGSAPVVCDLHGSVPYLGDFGSDPQRRDNEMASRLENWAVESADFITSPSLVLMDLYREFGWKLAGPRRVVRHPISFDDWIPKVEASQTSPIVLCPGRVEHRKGQDILVEAMRILRRDLADAKLVLIGASAGSVNGIEYADWLRQVADRNGVKLTLVPHLARRDLAEWYDRARVVVVPSRRDNFPVVVQEAMAMARPVVTTASCGACEVLDDSCGAVVSPEDPESLADALRRFLMDAETAGAAGRAARDRVVEVCHPESVARQKIECYEEAIVGRQKRRFRRVRQSATR